MSVVIKIRIFSNGAAWKCLKYIISCLSQNYVGPNDSLYSISIPSSQSVVVIQTAIKTYFVSIFALHWLLFDLFMQGLSPQVWVPCVGGRAANIPITTNWLCSILILRRVFKLNMRPRAVGASVEPTSYCHTSVPSCKGQCWARLMFSFIVPELSSQIWGDESF